MHGFEDKAAFHWKKISLRKQLEILVHSGLSKASNRSIITISVYVALICNSYALYSCFLLVYPLLTISISTLSGYLAWKKSGQKENQLSNKHLSWSSCPEDVFSVTFSVLSELLYPSFSKRKFDNSVKPFVFSYSWSIINTACKNVRIRSYSDPYFPVFSTNAGKYGPE